MGSKVQVKMFGRITDSIEEFPLQGQSNYIKKPRTLKGPLRVLRLCVLGIFTPALLLGLPLYMRYRVYGHQLYPLAMSDMRMLDSKVSTTWCQRQLVKVNTTFNAFLLPNTPQLSPEKKPLSMVRHLVLEDDTKEYWGFYLLRGTSVTVSTCVRWPGASLIVIRGHKHLHECAYIGDNSSEELEELMEAIREGSYVEPDNVKNVNSTEDEAPANEPELMKRHRPDVEFHSPLHKNNSKNHTMDSNVDTSEITDPKVMKILLEALQVKTKQNKGKHLGRDPRSHGHRNSTIAKEEKKNFKINPPKPRTTSEEVFSEILSKLRRLGDKGNAILEKVNQEFNQPKNNHTNQTIIDTKGRHYSKPPVNYNDNVDHERRKRQLYLSPAQEIAEDDVENDMAIEEGFTPDGIANHRGLFNETNLNDMSNSEFWSSFSSSEEALLNCDGLILNLPLTPHHKCQVDLNEEDVKESYRDNTVTYKVPTNGYYFFVFNSENEIQPNYVRVQFDLEKAVYNVSNPVAFCANSSESCALDLNFFSSEKLVMELPVNENQTLWNEEFIVVSECEPRTALYAICVIAVPILVILFAFT